MPTNLRQQKGLWWLLHKKTKISQSYSWEGIMQALPRVTLGKDLCKTRHQSLMGRNYASPNLHKTLILYDWYTISREGFMQNPKSVGTLPLVCKWLWISLQLSHSLQQVSTLFDFYTLMHNYRQNCYFNGRIYAKHKKSRYLVIICKWLWISLQLSHSLQQVSPL